MGNLTTALVIVLSLNLMMALTQLVTTNLNPEGPRPYTCQGSLIGEFLSNDCNSTEFILQDTDPNSEYPQGESSVNIATGTTYTDSVSVSKTWATSTRGTSYFKSLLGTPKTIMLAIGLPSSLASLVGAFWWSMTLFLIIGFLVWGRD